MRKKRFIIFLVFFMSVLVTKTYAEGSGNLLDDELGLFGFSLLNNGLFLVPPLLWNIVFAAKLPGTYYQGTVPGALTVVENILRAATMLYPVFIPIDTGSPGFYAGLATYSVGLALYYGSWAIQMSPNLAELQNNIFFKLAPAYTPIIWLIGIGIMSGSNILPALSTFFLATHVGEYLFRFDIVHIRY